MRREYLPQIAAGKLDFCIALTEPNAGSNTLAIETRAVRDGDVYRINGQKIWISGIQQAQKALVVTRTTPLAEAPKKSYGISLFIADVPSDGLTFQPIEKMGTHTYQSNMVYFDDLRVRADHLIGQENEGWKALLDVLNTERMLIAAGCVAAADIALGIAARYAGERKVFGRPIGANQGIQFPLADLKIRTGRRPPAQLQGGLALRPRPALRRRDQHGLPPRRRCRLLRPATKPSRPWAATAMPSTPTWNGSGAMSGSNAWPPSPSR